MQIKKKLRTKLKQNAFKGKKKLAISNEKNLHFPS